MSTWRISMNCPVGSAPVEFVDSARLDGHVLQFSGPDQSSWRGAVASVAASECDIVWGVLWKVSSEHLHNLDM